MIYGTKKNGCTDNCCPYNHSRKNFPDTSGEKHQKEDCPTRRITSQAYPTHAQKNIR